MRGGTCVTATSDEVTISARHTDGAASATGPLLAAFAALCFHRARPAKPSMRSRSSGHHDRPSAGLCLGFPWRGVRPCRPPLRRADHARVIDGDCNRHRQRDHRASLRSPMWPALRIHSVGRDESLASIRLHVRSLVEGDRARHEPTPRAPIVRCSRGSMRMAPSHCTGCRSPRAAGSLVRRMPRVGHARPVTLLP